MKDELKKKLSAIWMKCSFSRRGVKEYITVDWKDAYDHLSQTRGSPMDLARRIITSVFPDAHMTSGGSFDGGTWRLNPKDDLPRKVKPPAPVVFTFTQNESISVVPGKLESTIVKGHGRYAAAVDGMEALLLAMSSEGIRLNTEQMRKAVSTAYEAIINHYD